MERPSEVSVALSDQLLTFGADAAGTRLAAELARRGHRRVVVFLTRSLRGSAAWERVRDRALADVEVVLVDDDIQGHAPVAATERIAASLAGVEADAFVSIGGGSVSDTAKGVAILLAEGGHLEQHCSVFEPPDRLVAPRLDRPKVPLIALPTTLSGAEVTPGGGATAADGTKRTFWDPQVAARVVALDDDLLGQVPAGPLLTSGMNGLAHCAEGLYSRTANPVASGLAVAGAGHFAAGLPALADGDRSPGVLARLAAGAALGGLVISSARVGLHHAICHVLGGRLGVPHGEANSIVLPHVLRFNVAATAPAQAQLAAALSQGARTAPEDAAPLVDELVARIGVPSRLRDVGVDHDRLPEVAEATMRDRGLYFNPRRVERPDQVLDVLAAAW